MLSEQQGLDLPGLRILSGNNGRPQSSPQKLELDKFLGTREQPSAEADSAEHPAQHPLALLQDNGDGLPAAEAHRAAEARPACTARLPVHPAAEAPPSPPSKTIADMADDLIGKLGKSPGKSADVLVADGMAEHSAAKPKAGCQKTQPVLKRPAAKPLAGPAAKHARLDFPGIGGSAPPLRYGDVTVYTSVASKSWRVLKSGERVDKKFRWGATGVDPEEVWSRLVTHVTATAVAA